ncbi:MAG TPA: SDR family NAD(P)-dependent oxidoreductase [Vicinamibacteria bacterium]
MTYSPAVLTLAGRRALVTGGSRGIGRAVCVLFARLGARVAVHYASDERAAGETIETIRAAGGEAHPVRADLADPAAAGALVQTAVDRLGGVDTLVVNHGIWKRAPIDAMTPAEWDETLRVNLTSVYALCHAVSRPMIAQRSGAIVTIASTAGQRGEPYYSHYAATKGALIAFTKSLAAELSPHGIRVNCVSPGWIITDMTRDALAGPEGPEALAKIPLGRPGRPDEIAGPVAFLVSDLASYMYGEVLAVNGGAVMTG